MESFDNIKRIGVISDTHVPSRAKKLPEKVLSYFFGVDLIIHCGDVTSPVVLEKLGEIAPVRGVKGNCDGDEIDLPRELCLNINGRFIVCAGHNVEQGNYLYKTFLEKRPEIVLTGHHHVPYYVSEEVKLFNPGSAGDSRKGKNTIGILSVEEDRIIPEIIEI